MADLPVVVIFSKTPVARLQTPPGFIWETRELDCRWFPNDFRLAEILAREKPHVIVSFGRRGEYSRLEKSPRDVQKRWLHFEGEASASQIQAAGAMAFTRFLDNALGDGSIPDAPLVSVFTPTFRTGEKRLKRAFHSLRAQSYCDWEWIVVDDSDDENQTLKQLQNMAASEPRIKVFPSSRRSGIIGELKHRACALSEGEILLELDHDDELTPRAIENVVRTFAQFQGAGFAYSDWAEVGEETGEALTYAENWAFGYGSYRSEEYSGRALQVAAAPPINAATIRHIVSAPNHLRAWRADEYWKIGGHNRELHVADDYELVIRTFLKTRMAHIPTLCYLQYQTGGQNTTDVRRYEIQRLVRSIGQRYDAQIHARLLELGMEDSAWDEANGGASFPFEGAPGARLMESCELRAEL